MTTLTMKDEKRIEVIQRVFRGELTVGEAAMILGGAQRQQTRFHLLHNLLLERSFKLPPLLSHRSALSRGSILPAG